MKQTQKTRVVSGRRREAIAYSLARGKAAAVTREIESGGVLSGAREKATLVTCT